MPLDENLGNGLDEDQNAELQSVTTEDVVVNQSLTVGFAPLELGNGATAGGSSVALGQNANADNAEAVAIGQDADGGSSYRGTVLGYGTQTNTNNECVVIGHTAQVGGGKAVAVGRQTNASGGNSSALGFGSQAGQDGVAIGANANSNGSVGAIAIGTNVAANTSAVARIGGGQLVFGGIRDQIADADINNSELTIELDEANSAFRLRGKDSGGVVREATIAW